MSKFVKIKFALLLVLGIAAAGCSTKKASKDLLLSTMDTTVNPADDFFLYANGKWIKNNPIPAAYSSWGIGNLIEDEIDSRLRAINEEASTKQNVLGSNSQKIGDFWKSAMDTVAIEKQGVTPLKSELNVISKIKSGNDALAVAALHHTYGLQSLFSMYVSQDQKNSDAMALYFCQGGIGLPDRDYFFNKDPHSVSVRNAYKTQYIPQMLKFAGVDPALAASIYKLEEGLAKASRKLEDLRDPYKNYNKVDVAGLNKLTPGIDWVGLLKIMKVPHVDSVIVCQPEYFSALAKLIKETPVETLKAYLTLDVIGEYSGTLCKAIDKAHFHFYGSVLMGAKEQRPRWKRVLSNEESVMGEILGQQFVSQFFSAKTKQRYEAMVENVKQAFGERIKRLDWMTDATKQKALDKLSKVGKKVGYPNKWKDMSGLHVTATSYTQNLMNAGKFWYAYELKKLGKPVDRTEWNMTPQTYNAYYDPSNNEIVLPAAIFAIPGWADEDVDDAIAYGYAAASTIGHEITHGFDDQGCQYDAKGNLVKWWSPADEANFKARTSKIVKQFSSFVVLDSLHINGEATQGENIADLGGVVIGWDAFTKTEQYKKGKKINGLTPSQRFFLGYALGWLYHPRNEALANQIMTDVHSPAALRVNGPFSNVDAFYKAFNVKPGNKMYVPDSLRVKIW